ncbi:MAG: hypothetical protein ACYDBV_04135 [Nitrospiria bacterium]
MQEEFKADAILLSTVTSWGYGREEGDKVGRVGLGLKLIDSSTGNIVWKANHEIVEDYWFFRPRLEKMADKLVGMLINDMPIKIRK